MNMTRAVLIAVLLFQVAHLPCAAQKQPVPGHREGISLVPGARVRVTATGLGHKPAVCKVVAVDGDRLVLETDVHAVPLTLSLVSVQKLEVSRGRRSKTGKYAVIGGLAGMILGAGGGISCEGGG